MTTTPEIISGLILGARRLGDALDCWDLRDDTRPQPEVREAANTAMDAIDAMLRELHLLRARLVSEIRARDDERARRRAGRGGRP